MLHVRYTLGACLLVCKVSQKSITEISIFEFLQKGIIMHELMAGLNADKFATFWMLPTSFYYSFVLQMTFIHSTTG